MTDSSRRASVLLCAGLALVAHVTLRAEAVRAQDWTVVPAAVDFGVVGTGRPVYVAVSAFNASDQTVTLAESLEGPPGVFSFYRSTTSPTLGPGEIGRWSVGFQPDAVAEFAGILHLGGGAPDVPLHGTGVPPTPGCLTEVTDIDFGIVAVGARVRRHIDVTNTGTTVLSFDPLPAYQQHWPFNLTARPDWLSPGEVGIVTVEAKPLVGGEVTASLDLGSAACAPIVLTVDGLIGEPGENLMVVSFAPDRVDRYAFIDEPDTVLQAWLMLSNPSFDDGVYGWETRIEASGDLVLLGVQPMGQFVNFATLPDLVVGLASPLPPSELVVLAELQFLAPSTMMQFIELLQPTTPSLAIGLAWAYNSNYDLMPAFPWGQYAVAWVNAPESLPLIAPSPLAAVSGRRVELRWPVPAVDADGCHVHRSLGGQDTRLTSEPLRPGGGGYVYVDEPGAVPGGASAAYSYAVIRDGIEIARSPAVTIELPAAAALVDRLLPNRPNPFNPETTIPFELARAGRVRIAVFDAAGRRVALLEDGHRAAGPHQVVWRGRDDAGRALPSGAYFVQMESQTRRDTFKMLLLK